MKWRGGTMWTWPLGCGSIRGSVMGGKRGCGVGLANPADRHLQPRHRRTDHPHRLPSRGASVHQVSCNGAGESLAVAPAGREGSGRHGDVPPRWELFFQRRLESLQANRPFDEHACHGELLKLEDQWASQSQPYSSKPMARAQVAGRLFAKYMQGINLAGSQLTRLAVSARRGAGAGSRTSPGRGSCAGRRTTRCGSDRPGPSRAS